MTIADEAGLGEELADERLLLLVALAQRAAVDRDDDRRALGAGRGVDVEPILLAAVLGRGNVVEVGRDRDAGGRRELARARGPRPPSSSAAPRTGAHAAAVMGMAGSLSKSVSGPRTAGNASTRIPGTRDAGLVRGNPWTSSARTCCSPCACCGRDRAYAAAVILTLAICLGANTAIFTVVRSVLQRPLPYPESSRLVSSFDGFPGAGVERAGTSVPNYMDRRAMTDIFSSVALYQWSGYKFGQGAGSEQVSAMSVTPSFFQVARRERRPRPAPERGRRHARQAQGGGAQPGVRGQAARRARRRRRPRHPPQRRALQGRRRAARDLQLPQPRGPRLHAARLHARRSSPRIAAGARTTR